MLTNSLWHEIFWKKKSRLQPKSLGMVYSVQSQAAPVETQLRREPGLLALADSTGRDRLGGRPTPRWGGGGQKVLWAWQVPWRLYIT